MNRTITLEKHTIEAWGLWWVQWQHQTKEKLRRHKMSPQVFVDEHLVCTQGKDSLRDTTAPLILPSK